MVYYEKNAEDGAEKAKEEVLKENMREISVTEKNAKSRVIETNDLRKKKKKKKVC